MDLTASSASAALSRWGAVGAPQMFWWSFSSRLCLLLVSGSWQEAAPSIPWCWRASIFFFFFFFFFFGLPRLLPPGTVPCMMVFASPVARVTCPYHLSFLVLTIERRSSCGPMAALTRFLTSSFVILSLNEMPKIFPVTSHFEGLDPSFQFSSEGPCFTCVEEGWCDYWTKYLDPVFGGDFSVLPYCLELSQRRCCLRYSC